MMQVTRGRFLQKGLLHGAGQIREQEISLCTHGLMDMLKCSTLREIISWSWSLTVAGAFLFTTEIPMQHCLILHSAVCCDLRAPGAAMFFMLPSLHGQHMVSELPN
ncbi:unnamed protein product [Urochloa humidicola]